MWANARFSSGKATTRQASRLALLLAVLLLALPQVALAGLSEQDLGDIKQVEQYLGKLSTLQARFVQTGPNGELAEGELYLRRPGRLRFEYAPPAPQLVVADGTWLVLHDRELQHYERLPLYETPLGVLLAEKIDLKDKVEVIQVERVPGQLRLQMVDRQRPREGSLTLVFETPSLALRQWHVRDAQGAVTTVSLFDTQLGGSFKPELFVFRETQKFPRQ